MQIKDAITRAYHFKGGHWTPFVTLLADMPFCLVPVGEFMMGSDDGWENEKPIRQQRIQQPFWIAQHPVTNAQWRDAVQRSNGKIHAPNESDWYSDVSRSDHPVVGITWNQAVDFSKWLGGRLPSEAEWEYAARARESLTYPWGNDFKPELCIYDDTSKGGTAAIGGRPQGASWVGAQDMSGNVWEWCSDTLDGDYVMRGGSWYAGRLYARTAARLMYPPNVGIKSCGLRVLIDIPLSDAS